MSLFLQPTEEKSSREISERAWLCASQFGTLRTEVDVGFWCFKLPTPVWGALLQQPPGNYYILRLLIRTLFFSAASTSALQSLCSPWEGPISVNRGLHFFPPYLALPWHVEFPGQGSDLSHSYKLCCSCGPTRSLHPLCGAGDRACVLVLQRRHWSLCTGAGTPSPACWDLEDVGQEAGPQDVPSCPAPGQATFARCVCSCILLKRERRREHAPRPGGGPRGCPWHEGKPAPSWIIHQFLAAQRMHPCSQAPFSVGASVCGHFSYLPWVSALQGQCL